MPRHINWVSIHVPDLAVEVATLEDEASALAFLRGLVRGLAGHGDAKAEAGNLYGLRMWRQQSEYMAHKERKGVEG